MCVKRLARLGLCLVLMALGGVAFAAEVPEAAVHDAIMTMAWEAAQGELWVEGHVILGTEETDSTAKVFVHVLCERFGFMAGIFTDVGGGFRSPLALVFDKADGGYTLREILEPEDGEHYYPSLQAMMPEECLTQVQQDFDAHMAQMQAQMYAQAQAYLDSIGRTESPGDWRDLDLQLSGMLVTATNLTGGFSPPYPLWVTSLERLEDGQRYTYQRTWTPDGENGPSQTYATPDGDTLLCDGTTGTVLLTKTPWGEAEPIETITIRAELYGLHVRFADAYGQKDYHFAFDGLTYHQPTITQSGSCRIDDTWLYERSLRDLPE